MKLSIVILAAPYHSQGSLTALNFCQAALSAGHRIHRLFFYAEGVHNATVLSAPPQDETDLYLQWQNLIDTHAIDAVVCIAAALRRGLVDAGEAARYHKKADNLAAGFELGGLGLLIEAAVESDRVITFGA
ncbi:MAG TPA: sulfurtransferase complex subunit TusD [Cellvibrionaceae bacterium]